MVKKFINPSDLPNWGQAFTQVVSISPGPGKTVYISGQVAVDQYQNLIGHGDLAAQAMQAFKNLGNGPGGTDATTADVVKLNIYVKDYQPAHARLSAQLCDVTSRTSLCRRAPGWACRPWRAKVF